MLSTTPTVQGKFNSMYLCPLLSANFRPHSDAFAGGFCAGVVSGKSLDDSIDMGQWLASKSIQELGPS
jgi:hypothetical protein